MKSIALLSRIVAILAIPVAANAQGTPGMELKGFALGAPMSDCPAGTLQRTEKPPELLCLMGPNTLANEPVKSVLISIFDGRVASVMFFLERSGRYAHGNVRDALVEKFGPPDVSKSHLNEYGWRRGPERLALDGWKGHVVMYDSAEQERIRRVRSEAGKKDL